MAGLDHAPPPFFKRGPAPLALLTFYVALSLALFVVDLRVRSLDLVRQTVALVTDPLQRAAQMPASLLDEAFGYFRSMEELQQENTRLTRAQVATAPELLRLEHLARENARLRTLLALGQREDTRGQVATVLYTARDPFSRRIVIDKGQQAGIVPGQPAIDETGLIGQISRVFPFSAEVTLITDKDQAVPVQNQRTGQRSVVFGRGSGLLELRFIPNNADIEAGDLLVTSGLDSLFPPGFPVARVSNVTRENSYAFARVLCEPVGAVEHFGELMVLHPRPLPARVPEAEGRISNTGVPRKADKP